MHSYSLDNELRRNIYVALGVAAFALPSAVASATGKLQALLSSMPLISWPLGFGTTFALLFLLFDRYVWRWKWVRKLHGVPYLGGDWTAEGISSFVQAEETEKPIHNYQMRITIKQTFSQMVVSSETDDSTSRSTMSSICTNHQPFVFQYAFENTSKNVAHKDIQGHLGLIKLRIKGEDEMVGDYFSGKPRFRFGELTLTRGK